MIIQWTKFEKPEAEVVRPLHVTIQKRGHIHLNITAWRAMGRPEAVQLMFDRVNCLIGIQPSRPYEKNALEIRKRKQRGSYYVNARQFLNYFGIVVTKFTACGDVAPQPDGMIVVHLKEDTKYFSLVSGDQK